MTANPPIPIEPRPQPLAGYDRYEVGPLACNQDGGIRPIAYYLVKSKAPRSPLAGPPEYSPWETVMVGCLLGLGLAGWLYGAYLLLQAAVSAVGG